MYLSILIFGIVHKLSHYLTKIILNRFKNISTKLKDTIIALSGPLINIIIVIIINKLKINIFTGIIMITANLIIVIFSLIPIYPMSGGQILQIILKTLLGEEKGIDITNKISFVIIILITITASISILYLKDILILLAVVYLWYRYLNKNELKLLK